MGWGGGTIRCTINSQWLCKCCVLVGLVPRRRGLVHGLCMCEIFLFTVHLTLHVDTFMEGLNNYTDIMIVLYSL